MSIPSMYINISCHYMKSNSKENKAFFIPSFLPPSLPYYVSLYIFVFVCVCVCIDILICAHIYAAAAAVAKSL